MQTLSTARSSSSRQPGLVEHERAVGPPPVEQGVGHRVGLLADLLAHEVVVAALLRGREVPVDAERRSARPARRPASAPRSSPAAARPPGRRPARRAAGPPEQGRDVGGEQRRAVGQTDHERACCAGRPRCTSGSSAQTTAMENEPRTHPERRADRLGQRRARPPAAPRPGGRGPRCRSPRPSCARPPPARSASSAWFSMIPLWTTARRPVQSKRGWAFSIEGWPWVAQRVWPIPVRGPAGAAPASVSGARPPNGSRRRPGPARAPGHARGPRRPSRSRGTRVAPGPRRAARPRRRARWHR